MTILLDLLHELGAWSLPALWLPLLAWTLAVLAALALLHQWKPHPLVGYRARQALLFALLPGLALAAATDWALPVLPAAPPATTTVSLAPAAALAPAAPVAPAPALPPLTWMHAFGALTLAAALLAAWRLAHLTVSAVRLGRQRRALGNDVPAAVQSAADEVAARLNVRRRFHLAHAPASTAPMTLGPLRPIVALPQHLDGERLRMALTHELVHLRRRDDLLAGVEAFLSAFFFVHPLCALLRRQIGVCREEACDAAVLDASPFSPRRYAQLLYDVARAPRVPLALSLATPHRSLKKRLDAMKSAAPAPRFALLSAALTLALPLLLMACSDLSAPTEPDPAAASVPQTATAPDSLVRQSITSISVNKGGPDGNVIHVRVKSGAPDEVRKQLRRQLARSNAVDRVTISEKPAPAHGADAVSPGPDPTANDRLNSHIQSIEVEKSGRGTVHILLKPGTPDAIREQFRKQLRKSSKSMPDGPQFTVEVSDSDTAPTSQEAPRGPQAGAPPAPRPTEEASDASYQPSIEITDLKYTDGTLTGRIVDSSTGEVLAGANVILQPDGDDWKAGSANHEGRFRLEGASEGIVELRVSFIGYSSANVKLHLTEGRVEMAGRMPTTGAASDTTKFIDADKKPEIVGGQQALFDAIQYPDAALADSLEGTVYVQFVVGKEGRVRETVVLQSPAESLSQAALRAVRSLTFRPAEEDGKPVLVRMTLPIRFAL